MNDSSVNSRVLKFSKMSTSDIMKNLDISTQGLSQKEVEKNKSLYGSNEISGRNKDTVFFRFRKSFINPFSIVLFTLAIISFFTDIVFASEESKNYMTVFIILTMLVTSGIVRFIQEMRSKKVADNLTELVDTSVCVKRDDVWTSVNYSEIVVGDIVRLKSGDRVPADIRLTIAKDCFVSQSVITGESNIQEKTTSKLFTEPKNLSDYSNTVFLGTTIISGSCIGIVSAVGFDTVYGSLSPYIAKRKNGFDKGADSIAFVLIRFMVLLVPIVFIASGFTKGDWISSFLFALSVAVGLTPELLPMVITACLSKGSYNMGKKQTVVKNINAMQSFGSMDILCTDKTGTLTGDTLLLEYYMDILGNESQKTLDYSFLNSYYHSGVKNHLDNAILKVVQMPGKEKYYSDILSEYEKVDELPFDYERKIVSILLKKDNDYILISKGNVDDIIKRCKNIEYKGNISDIGNDPLSSAHAVVDDMLEDGMKILAVSIKHMTEDEACSFDENNMTLVGYLAFFDSPKKSATSALEKIKKSNIKIKVLTGDNLKVAVSVCKRLGIESENVMTGTDFENLSDNDVRMAVENTSIFAELTPKQKAQIVLVMQNSGHSVGFLGDGMNDLPSVLEADVGISVDTAAPSLKEAADVILLKKDLNVLNEGVIEGRRSFANMSKYIKITASSNLGNIFAIVIASIFLPFFPMTSIQILLLNLLYDILCLVLPWDNVDDELCEKPLEWSGDTLSRFMMFFGPLSSIFDIFTFIFLMFYLCPMMSGGAYSALAHEQQLYFVSVFQTGWFLESMWTQVLIIHLLRTKKLPLLQSKPSKIVILVTFIGIFVFTLLSMSPLGAVIGLIKLPIVYFVFLICTVIGYMLLITVAKKIYINKYHNLI